MLPRVTPALACRDRLAPDTLKGLLPLETTPVKNLKGKKKTEKEPHGPAHGSSHLQVEGAFDFLSNSVMSRTSPSWLPGELKEVQGPVRGLGQGARAPCPPGFGPQPLATWHRAGPVSHCHGPQVR